MAIKKVVKKSDILRAARRRIENQHNEYICYAITDAMVGTSNQRKELKTWAMQLLAPYASYGSWLMHNHERFWAEQMNKDSYLTEGRLQWLDWMINYWESKGE